MRLTPRLVPALCHFQLSSSIYLPQIVRIARSTTRYGLTRPFSVIPPSALPALRKARASAARLEPEDASFSDANAEEFDSESDVGLEELGVHDIEKVPASVVEKKVAPAFTLRPYQQDCVEACLGALREGYDRIGVSAPTGSGKTAIFTELIMRIPPIYNPSKGTIARRTLILVGSVELASQAAATVKLFYPNLSVEIEQGREVASGAADVTIATYQTLSRGSNSRLSKFDSTTFKAIFIDEAHHAVTRSHLGILAHFNSGVNDEVSTRTSYPEIPQSSIISSAAGPSYSSSVAPNEARFDEDGRVMVPVLGFTATFGRQDGLALGRVFQVVAWHGDWLEMIEEGWLSPLKFTTVRLESLDLSNVEISRSTNDFSAISLAKAVGQEEVVEHAVAAWFKKAEDRTSTLVFAINIDHIISLTNAFRKLGIDARFIHSGLKPQERRMILEAFRRKDFPVLVNCGILTEGADFPNIDAILLARPTKSRNLFLQMLGRGLRISPGKEDCLIIDLVGNSTAGVQCTPTLFGIDPDFGIEARSTSDLKKLSLTNPPIPLDEHPDRQRFEVSYRDYSSVFDLVKSHNGKAPSIRTLSRLAWIGCGDNSYVLEVVRHGHVKIKLVGPSTYEAKYYANNAAFFSRPRLLGQHSDLAILIRVADAFVTNNPRFEGVDLSRSAAWRFWPSTNAQRKFALQKLAPVTEETGWEQETTIEGVWVGKPWREKVEVESLTRGQMADVLCRVKHGGLGFWKKNRKKLETEEKKVEKAREKVGRRMEEEVPLWSVSRGDSVPDRSRLED